MAFERDRPLLVRICSLALRRPHGLFLHGDGNRSPTKGRAGQMVVVFHEREDSDCDMHESDPILPNGET